MKAQPQFPHEQSATGEFTRQEDTFRGWVSADGASGYPAASGRYHLYVSWACPWAHRTIIVRKLKQLEHVVGMTVVDPIRDERGWAFRDGPGHSQDPINGFRYLSEAYRATDPTTADGVTVPALWDTVTKRIVIEFRRRSHADVQSSSSLAFTDSRLDLYPADLRNEIEELNTLHLRECERRRLSCRIRDITGMPMKGRCGGSSRRSIELEPAAQQIAGIFFGSQFVETDWRLFVTLIRFDAVYHGHFKCNIRRIADYPNLFGYLKDLYQTEGIADTVNFDHIKRHYYVTHDDINPTRIVPLGPQQDLSAPHGRGNFD